MPLTERENFIQTIRFGRPEWMPCAVSINNASWDMWRGELETVIARYPSLFPGFQPGRRDYENMDFGNAYRAGERYTDAWGCVWQTDIDGIEGVVVEHPLADWEALKTYQPPDAEVQLDRGPANWAGLAEQTARTRQAGGLTSGSLAHGFLLMRMYYLRGFENLMLDFATGEPRLADLIALLNRHNRGIVDHYRAMGVDLMTFPEDLGTHRATFYASVDRWPRMAQGAA